MCRQESTVYYAVTDLRSSTTEEFGRCDVHRWRSGSRCPECGAEMVEEIEPDEKPDGTILGYPLWRCSACGATEAPE